MRNLTVEEQSAASSESSRSDNLWIMAWRRLRRNRVGMGSLVVVALFLLMVLLSFTGLIAKDWNKEVAVSYAPPSFIATASTAQSDAQQLSADATLDATAQVDLYGIEDPLAAEMSQIRSQLTGQNEAQAELQSSLAFGADRWGQDIISKTIKGSETSIMVGLIAALLAVAIGTLLGAVSGYFGGWLDDLINWFYNVFTSIPYMLLILAVAAVLQQKGMLSIILILGFTGWTGTYRLIRAEYMKHAQREYVMAAKAIGVNHYQRMFQHIFPNISHVVLVQMSILVVSFIKSEVILSFLGFGVPVGTVSWGSMLNEAQSEFILGKWWQLVAATAAMAILVTAFSLFTDALRDALDPKIK
ncbi:peptide/nickel transport system permease protein [Acinetobacter calcoaceticus]|uniref:Peptide/nickel transport system permease protein n=1 Tax=Acinetobacter calcoaceticus TaxID=471 RepID=A0A4R1XSF7_ACICA|nr:peptide/nickel transport system permease protein [Acinetobacter calcoaceticus]